MRGPSLIQIRQIDYENRLRQIGQFLPTDPNHPAYAAMAELWHELVERPGFKLNDAVIETVQQDDDLRKIIARLVGKDGTVLRRKVQGAAYNYASIRANGDALKNFNATIARLLTNREIEIADHSPATYRLLTKAP